MDQTNNNFRSSTFNDVNNLPTTYGNDQYMHTPFAGNVRALAPPPLPQPPTQSAMYNNYYPSMGGGMYGGYSGYGGGGYGGYGGYGGGSFGGYGGMYNRFGAYGSGMGMNPLDPEYRLIKLAEELKLY